MKLIHCRPATGIAVLILATAPLAGQNAPAPESPPASGESAELAAPTVLSEFQVSAPKDNGYVATNSVLGNRIATPIQELPFSVDVVTSNLMQDFGMFEMDENVTFVSSFVGLSQGGQYQLRGFNQSYSLEDGFTRLGRYGTINVDRIEVIKGPSAAVYGEATPGGMVNIVTKQPEETPEQSITVDAGSYRTTNVTLQAGGPVGTSPGNYYIMDAGDYEHAYDVAFAELRNEELYGAFRHDFSEKSSLTVQWDYYHNAQDAPQQILPFNYNSKTGVYTGTLAYNLADLSRTGPDAWHDRGINSFTAIYENQLSSVWSLRLGMNGYYATYNDFNNGVNTQFDIYALTIGRGTPSLNLFNEDGDAEQADLVAHYKLFGGNVDNRELFTLDLNDYYHWDKQWSLGSAYTVLPYFQKTITLGQPVNYYVPPFNTNEYNSISNNYKNRGIIDGAMYRHQTSLFDDRVLLFASAREDYVDINLHDIAGGVIQHAVRHYFDPSVGFNAEVVPGVRAYWSYSTAFDADVQGLTASSSHPINPAVTGWGDDYGLKCNLLNDRLIFTLGGYYIPKENTTVSVLQPNGSTVDEPEGTQLSRGLEFDFTYAMTSNLFFGGGVGHVNTKITNDGDNTEAVGRVPANVPTDNIGVYTRYQFGGILNGLYTNLSYNYISPTHPESPTSGDTITKGVYTSSNFEWAVKIPGYYYLDWSCHYNLPNLAPFHLHQTVGLIVKNVLNRFYVNSNDYVAAGRGYYFVYTLAH